MMHIVLSSTAYLTGERKIVVDSGAAWQANQLWLVKLHLTGIVV